MASGLLRLLEAPFWSFVNCGSFSGEGDGFDGVYPASSDLAYMTGYSQGLRRKLADIQRQALLLQEEGLAVEAMFGEELEF